MNLQSVPLSTSSIINLEQYSVFYFYEKFLDAAKLSTDVKKEYFKEEESLVLWVLL